MVLLLQVRSEKKFLHSESIGQCSAGSCLSYEQPTSLQRTAPSSVSPLQAEQRPFLTAPVIYDVVQTKQKISPFSLFVVEMAF